MPNSGCKHYDPVEGQCGKTCAQDSNYCNNHECTKEGCHKERTKDRFNINLKPTCLEHEYA